jgi:YesN/AraC family two-component response regulator
MKDRLLFVDDEASIRVTLAAILSQEGFDVTVAESVPEALEKIHKHSYDILLSDLNIGQPGDGFTVVSAMRRSQPEAATFILTGYPDFESALLAIRNQVDDYLTKPTDVKKLVATLKEKSAAPYHSRSVPKKRISVIVRERLDEIVERWLEKVESDDELAKIKLERNDRINHVPALLEELTYRIEHPMGELRPESRKAASEHGSQRLRMHYSIPMMIKESRLLVQAITSVLQEQLLSIDISTLISDTHQMEDGVIDSLETSVRSFVQRAAA